MKITKQEIRALNRARAVLAEIEMRALDAGYERAREAAREESYDGGSRAVMACGRLAQATDAAEAAVFRVLNVARAYADVEISDDEMHNRRPEAVTA